MPNEFDILRDSVLNYVVRPLNAFGLGGFVFDIEGETTVNLSTEITDHFLEDNSSVQDHIAIRPKKITLKGFVGELTFDGGEEDDGIVQTVTRKLTILSAFLPTLSAAAEQLVVRDREVNSTESGENTVNNIADYWAFIKNITPPISKQEQAYRYFKALMEQKILVSVQTPFEFMTRMAIETVTARQGADSRFISDFSITLKEIRTVSLLTASQVTSRYTVQENIPSELFQGRSLEQREELTQVGNMAGLEEQLTEIYTAEELEKFL
ncbi:MAG: hypothetical protein COB09_19135 [Thalassobium sp.]|nr:MAG: hypothetical protein COB09_19135 [Thalassobium sp.]